MRIRGVFIAATVAVLGAESWAQPLDYRFKPPLQVNQEGGPHHYHMTYSSGGKALATFRNDVYVVCSDHTSGNWNVMFTASRDGGLSFGPNQVVNDTAQGEPSDQLSPSIAVDFAGKIYVAWQDNREEPSRIYLAKSLDRGFSFSENRSVGTGQGGGQYTPALAVGPQRQIYVAWSEYLVQSARIFMGRSEDEGKSFEIYPVDTASGVDQHYPALAAGKEGELYLAWTEASVKPTQVFFARSTDSGRSFSSKTRLSEVSPGNQLAPSLNTGPDGAVYAAWTDIGAGTPKVRLARSLTRGSSFGPAKTLGDEEAQAADQPSVSVATSDSGRVAVAWQDNRFGPANIAIAFSKDGGSTYRSDYLLGGGQRTKGMQSYPSIAFRGGGSLNAAWTEYRASAGEVQDDILYSLGEWPSQPAAPMIPSPTAFSKSDSLYQNYPDPMTSRTTIRFDLLGEKELSFVTLKIYDLTYLRVRTLVSGWKSPGSYRLVWDGKPDTGVNVPGGVYYYQLVVTHPKSGAKPYVSTKRLVLSR